MQLKSYLLILFSFLILTNCTAQTYKVYIDSKGNFVVNRSKASGYMLIRKNADSDYSVQKYNMKDTISMKGGYKDSSLTIPNGKFVFYKKRSIPVEFNGIIRADTNNYVSKVGYYLNGKKTGMWVEFYNRRSKRCNYIYRNDTLNGIYQKYHKYISGYLLEEGNYVGGKKDGEWNFYGYDTLKTPLITQLFKNGQLQKEIDHVKLAYFTGDPNKYLRKALKISDTTKRWSIILEITINSTGGIKNAKLIRSSLPTDVNNKVPDVLMKMPNFIPELRDGQPKESIYTFVLLKDEFKYSLNNPYGYYLTKEVGNGISIESRNGLIEEHDLFPDDPDLKDDR